MNPPFFRLTLALLAICGPAAASPFIPQRGDQVIETLPKRSDPTQQELKRLRAALSARPTDLALATDLAQRYITVGRELTDPRYLGYAEAALAPWYRLPAPPVPVRLLRATLLQSTHHFPAALLDLDAVIAAAPDNGQAWLTRATVLTVRGDYAGASRDCARVSGLSNELVAITCLSQVAAATGRGPQAEALLDLTLQRADNAPPPIQLWVLTQLAEMATRRGASAVAEARYRRALALAPQDSYLLGAYTDFLLDQHRPADVLALLKGQQRVDALLLRYALALQLTPGRAADLAEARTELGARFSAAMQRGDTVHQREQARYELALLNHPESGLQLARLNWDVQKEIPDMRIYLEAALAGHDPAAAKPVLDWIAANKTDDVVLARLTRQLKAGA